MSSSHLSSNYLLLLCFIEILHACRGVQEKIEILDWFIYEDDKEFRIGKTEEFKVKKVGGGWGIFIGRYEV